MKETWLLLGEELSTLPSMKVLLMYIYIVPFFTYNIGKIKIYCQIGVCGMNTLELNSKHIQK